MGDSRLGFSRWWLVLVTALAMGAVGTYQFTWSSIRVPLSAQVEAPEAALGTAFTIYVIFQTISQFPAGWVRDRYGPRIPVLLGAPLVVAGYAGLALASSSLEATLALALGGVGAGVVYTVAVNTPVKWFDERRGLATGVATTTYGGLSFVAIPWLRDGLETDFDGTLFVLAGLVGVAVLVGVPLLRDPDSVEQASPGDEDVEGATDVRSGYTWRDAAGTWQFWLLYVVFVVVHGVGLMLIGKVVAFAAEVGLSAAAATASASLVALGDAVGLLIVGAISDRLGRVRTFATSLTLAGLCLALTVAAGPTGIGLGFVVAATATAFFRSPAFVIVPGIVGDFYGTRYSSEVYAALYTAKLWGGVIGGIGASVLIAGIDWIPTFAIGAGLFVAAGLATFALRPVER